MISIRVQRFNHGAGRQTEVTGAPRTCALTLASTASPFGGLPNRNRATDK